MLHNQDLTVALLAWDGKYMAYLSGLYDQQMEKEVFFEDITELFVQVPSLQKATSWLFNHHYEQKGQLKASMIERIYGNCGKLKDWEAILHVLQLLPFITLAMEQVETVELFIRKQVKHPNKMVRAWALNGLHVLMKYVPELKEELAFQCEQALYSEAPSVQARARNIMKALKKGG